MKGDLKNLLKNSVTTRDDRDEYQYLVGEKNIFMTLDDDNPAIPETKKPLCQLRYINWAHH